MLTLASIMLVLSCSKRRDKQAGLLLARTKSDFILMFEVERPQTLVLELCMPDSQGRRTIIPALEDLVYSVPMFSTL